MIRGSWVWPRASAVNEAVLRVALLALLANAARVPFQVVWLGMLAARPPEAFDPVDELTPLVWLPAYLALLYGRVRAAAVLASVGLAPSVLDLGTGSGFGWQGRLADVAGLAFDALPLAAMAVLWRAPAHARPRAWLLALPAAVVALPAAQLTAWLASRPVPDVGGAYCVSYVIAAAGYLLWMCRPPRGSAGRAQPVWPLALALIGAAVLAQRVATLPLQAAFATQFGAWGGTRRPLLVTAGEVVALVVAVLLLARRVGQQSRRASLAPVPPTTPPDPPVGVP
ncbi:hypothetical protein [Motilibacter deserti]|uniref:Uncharacterized protein n=1 Tax=Motilibacter deserti TaxID=2714956 RepID=A0ABX0GYQ6_9ACTN|nr:hypothetical protein [Motilibacter deserti]NHC16093.1 hypothetical protein [Motilibacter deserti]